MRFRFSTTTLLLIVLVVALIMSLAIQHWRMAKIEAALEAAQRELAVTQPLSAAEVARQFEAATNLGPNTTKVTDVRYSKAADAYRVAYHWTNSNTKQIYSSELELKGSGFGTYWGEIRSPEFFRPLGTTREGFSVAVKTPSALEGK